MPSKFAAILTKPLELLGGCAAGTMQFAWLFSGKFLLSPWGLLVPITLLTTLLLLRQVDKAPDHLADGYAAELEQADAARVPVLVGMLGNMGEPGIPHLVDGLCSKRENVFLACRDRLTGDLKRWETLPDREERTRNCRILADALLDRVQTLSPTGREEAHRLGLNVLRMLGNDSSSSTPTPSEIAESRRATSACERLMEGLETARRRMVDPLDPLAAPTTEMSARSGRGLFDPVLVASNSPVADDPHTPHGWDPLAAPRAERLLAYHDSPLYQKQKAMAYTRPDPVTRPESGAKTMLASMGLSGPSPNELAASVPSAPAEQSDKVAARYDDTTEPVQMGIARDYLSRMNRDHGRENNYTPPPDDLLTPDLRDMTPQRVAGLSTTRLMRLLHHPDDRCVSEARKTLIARDGFRDAHLRLAFRLYHPIATIREELVSLLPYTTGVQPNVWLVELLNDPDAEVRYKAASFLATSEDGKVRRLLVEKGKRDPDARIVKLATQLQQTPIRRARGQK